MLKTELFGVSVNVGAKDLAEALKSNAVLSSLNLGYNNKLGDEGGRAIFDALQSNTSLQVGVNFISVLQNWICGVCRTSHRSEYFLDLMNNQDYSMSCM